MIYQAIVLAAGNSSRSGLNYNKVFYKIANGPIIAVSINNFLLDNDCEKIFLVCKEKEIAKFKEVLPNSDKIHYVLGGMSRQESVYNALKEINSEFVLIHDGARPYYTQILINRLKEKLQSYDAIVPVWTLKDTVKIVKDGLVVKTLNRDELRATQTPQAFRTSIILKAHEMAKKEYSDDASMVEDLLDIKVCAIDGEYSNTKFTFKEEF